MRWIKPCFFWILLPLLGLSLLLPGLVGWLLARSYPTSLDAIALQLPRYTLVSTDVEGGWFRSRARSRWTAIDGDAPITTDSQLHHGPIIFSAGRPRLAWWSESISLSAFDQPYLQANYETSWSGSLKGYWDGTLTRQPWLLAGHGELEYQFGRGTAAGNFVLDQVAGWTSAGRTSAALEGQVSIEPQQFSLLLQSPDVLIDDRAIANDVQFELALSAQQQQAGSATAAMTLEKVSWADLQLANIRADLTINRIDLPSLSALWQQWQRLNQTAASAELKAGQFRAQLLLALPDLLQHRPTAMLRELRLATPEGPASAEAELRFLRDINPADLIDPARLLAAVEGFARGELPRTYLEQWAARTVQQNQPWLTPTETAQLAQDWVNKNIENQWLAQNGDRVRFDWRLQDGALELNNGQVSFQF